MGRNLTIRLTEDRPGQLSGMIRTLSEAGVNIEGLAEVGGVVHLVARDPSRARSALRGGGYGIEDELEVLIVPLTDRPGELSMTMGRLAEAGVNVRFLYLATQTRVVIAVDDIVKARAALGPGSN